MCIHFITININKPYAVTPYSNSVVGIGYHAVLCSDSMGSLGIEELGIYPSQTSRACIYVYSSSYQRIKGLGRSNLLGLHETNKVFSIFKVAQYYHHQLAVSLRSVYLLDR